MESSITETIHQSLTMEQVALFYQPNPIKKGYILCPIHGEKTPSLRLYTNSFYCFGCNVGGDVIQFVEHLFHLDFAAAVARLDYDFNLHLGLGKKLTLREKKAAREKQKIQAEKQRQRQAKERQWWDIYQKLTEGWCRLEMNQRNYAPKSPKEALHPLFIEAIQNLDYIEYLLDCHIGARVDG